MGEEATAAADRMMIAPTPSNEVVLENITGNTRHYSARSDGSNSVCSSMDSAGSLLDPDFDIYSEDWSSKGTLCVDIMNAPKKNDEVNKENMNNRELVRTVSHGSTASSCRMIVIRTIICVATLKWRLIWTFLHTLNDSTRVRVIENKFFIRGSIAKSAIHVYTSSRTGNEYTFYTSAMYCTADRRHIICIYIFIILQCCTHVCI